ncbi:hypothetical protein UFOVP273_130 [uncultured Caudovirales phage]|uniref:Uncharacterized protein n=1 Tax=uncultured Caudovirales phage TaxID=2100421 RepID=A0A6J5LJY7_9CAUD|nr:hypothetical protein UFOVP273_130 [uncultured Caudovirales phage]
MSKQERQHLEAVYCYLKNRAIIMRGCRELVAAEELERAAQRVLDKLTCNG